MQVYESNADKYNSTLEDAGVTVAKKPHMLLLADAVQKEVTYKLLFFNMINVKCVTFIKRSRWLMVCFVSCLLQEKDLVNRYTEATANNTQLQKQMGLAKNLVLQVRKQFSILCMTPSL